MSEQLYRISPTSENHRNIPMALTIKGLEKPGDGAWALEDVDSGETLPLQAENAWGGKNVWLRFILPELNAGQGRTFRLKMVEKPPVRCQITELDGERLELTVDGKPVTRYNYADSWARPFLWPLIGADGQELTRPWPMEQREGEKEDHPHHKSVWSALGDVNGCDNWSELEGHACTRHEGFVERTSGPVLCRFSTKEDWIAPDGAKILRSYVEVAAYAVPDDERVLDYTICLRALDTPLKVGDTKEGGIISVRMLTSMSGEKGGLIENACGGATEKECWGQPAPWVDYSGQAGSGIHGIALFDHPDNPCHPTRWHVRNYGLFTANPFALHDYLGDDSADGSMTIPAGEVRRFQYRMYLHRGRAADSNVAGKYQAFAAPPSIAPVE